MNSAKPYVIAGPCSAESEEMVLESARFLAGKGVKLFRAGVWKPRSRPGNFEGIGEEGLEWLSKVRAQTGLRVCTEVACKEHVEACLKYGIDVVWIGARTTTNPFLVQEIADALAGSGVGVLIKNPVSPDVELWSGAVERIMAAGISEIGIIHRGFKGVREGKYRNNPEWQLAVGMRKRFPQARFICDPSHMAGKADLVPELAQRSLDIGFDSLMVEVHPNPSQAWSDAPQQLSFDAFSAMLEGLELRRSETDEDNASFAVLRSRIDELDDELLTVLASRMEVSREIGRLKKERKLNILQPERWDVVIESALKKASENSLTEEFVRDLYNLIHSASLDQQK